MKKRIACILSGVSFFSVLSITYKDSIFKKRNSLEQQSRELQRILNVIGEQSCTQACEKIKGVQNLFDDLHVQTALQARETLNSLRIETKTTLEQLEANYNNALKQLRQQEQEYLDKIKIIENSMQTLLSTLQVASFEKAIDKINHLQSSYTTIARLVHTMEIKNE